MSLEQLLFFLILVAIPLLERLVQMMRDRASGSGGERTPPAERTAAPQRPDTPQRPVPVPDPGASSSPQVATARPRPISPLPPPLPPVARHEAASQPAPVVTPARTRREQSGRPTPAPRFLPVAPQPALRHPIGHGDLQRAIVLIAIFGPCRAIEPKDPTQPG